MIIIKFVKENLVLNVKDISAIKLFVQRNDMCPHIAINMNGGGMVFNFNYDSDHEAQEEFERIVDVMLKA